MLTRPGESSLATPGLAAFLTWKQAELLLVVADSPKKLDEIGDVVREIHKIDTAAGNRPLYWGVDNSSLRSSLNSLTRRGLLHEDRDGIWRLTMRGRDAVEIVR